MSSTSTDPTKGRLLEAAGQEFAEHGFGGATVRAICRKAGANVAAVNYHFGDKEQLYTAAVLEAHRCGLDEEAGPTPDLSPEDQLRWLIRYFLKDVLAIDRQRSWHHALILRELLKPTSAQTAVVRQVIRPRFERLRAILGRLCPGADERRLRALAFTLIGQCLFYRVARPVAEQLVGAEGFAELDVEYLTDHISRVVLAATGRGPGCVDRAAGEPVEAGAGGG